MGELNICVSCARPCVVRCDAVGRETSAFPGWLEIPVFPFPREFQSHPGARPHSREGDRRSRVSPMAGTRPCIPPLAGPCSCIPPLARDRLDQRPPKFSQQMTFSCKAAPEPIAPCTAQPMDAGLFPSPCRRLRGWRALEQLCQRHSCPQPSAGVPGIPAPSFSRE